MVGFCATHTSTNLKKAVLNGNASAVAMHPPQRNAAANSHGVSRSRRSRNHSTASGTRASRLERASARKNTSAMCGGMPLNKLSWMSAAKASTTSSAAPIAMHMPGRRSGEPMRRRS